MVSKFLEDYEEALYNKGPNGTNLSTNPFEKYNRLYKEEKKESEFYFTFHKKNQIILQFRRNQERSSSIRLFDLWK